MSDLFVPHPYQRLLIEHFLDLPRCAGWAGMGLGKTVSTLTALDTLSFSEDPFPALIAAPLRVARRTWGNEVAKWDHLSHLRVATITGDLSDRKDALKRKADIYTINYENLPWLVKTLGSSWPFRTVVSDESRKLKGFRGGFRRRGGAVYYQGAGGQRTRALGSRAWKSSRFIELTGTPSSKGLEDLWGQLWFLDAGHRLGASFDAFSRRWFRLRPGSEPKAQILELASPFAGEEIRERVRDICLSIRPEDWFDLAAPIEKVVEVEMPAPVRAIYEDMQADFFTEIEAVGVEAVNAAARSLKLLQIANGAIYMDKQLNWKELHDEKVQALESIIEEAGGAPVMVAYHFDSDRERLLRAFPRARVLRTARDEDDFRAGRTPILLVHPQSAGHGIDGFQNVCNIIVFFGHWWDLELREQVIERIGPVRQMQAKTGKAVFIYDIVAARTIDQVVLKRHKTKRSVQDLLLAAARGIML